MTQKTQRLLIIENKASDAKQLKRYLENDFDITFASEVKRAEAFLGSGLFPVAILNLDLHPSSDSPETGLRLLEKVPNLSPHTKMVVVTKLTQPDVAMKAIALSAMDCFTKPIDLNVLRHITRRAFHIHDLENANRQLLQQADHSTSLCGMIGVSETMQSLFKMIRKASAFQYSALITGESGTGKQMVAQALHELSPRSKNPFVIINCAAIQENLLESELFGHEKGAFTGAVSAKKGKFELADGGTILLDEIGELPLALQAKLLRCLQEGAIERVGGENTLSLDLCILAATNRNLKESVAQGIFREDLYFRLNVVPIVLPPLRERPEDIMALASHFLETEIKALGLPKTSFSTDAMAALSAYEWPGNVRELHNRIRRALAVAADQTLTARHLDLETHIISDTPGENLLTLQQARQQAERYCIQQALWVAHNNISQAAKLMGISRPTLHDLLKKHDIKV